MSPFDVIRVFLLSLLRRVEDRVVDWKIEFCPRIEDEADLHGLTTCLNFLARVACITCNTLILAVDLLEMGVSSMIHVVVGGMLLMMTLRLTTNWDSFLNHPCTPLVFFWLESETRCYV